MTLKDKYSELSPDCFYHVFNRANGNEKIFLSGDNYHFFLKKYQEHIDPIAKTHSYCLIPNHFHFLIQIKSEEEIKTNFQEDFKKFNSVEKLVSKQFANFFSSYTQAFNKQQNRMGSLFMKNFKRIRVNDENYRLKLVHYIHLNPIEAGLCGKPHQWPFSSYNQLISNKQSEFLSLEAIDWFDDIENFKSVHSNENFSSNLI